MSEPAPRLRCFLGAFGDAGHAFPMLALGAELARRGHEVTFETWTRWRQYVEASGMRFVAAPEFPVFPTRDRPLSPYEAVVAAVAQTRPAVAAAAADVVVHDILTLAPALSSTTVSTVNSPAASSMPPQVTCPAGLSAQSPDLLARITDCTVLPSRGPAARAFTVRRRVSWICCASASATSSSVT